jgi:hypothetical protein
MTDIMDVAIPNPIGLPQTSADSGSEDERWRAWKQKGRDQDARSRRRLRAALIAVAVGGSLWFASTTWL